MQVLIVGGSETTATLLCAVTFYLLRNPHILTKLNQEVRSTFKSDSDINTDSVQSLDYMLAVLNETLRIHPPVAAGLPRDVPQGGASVAGYYVPEGTVVGIHHWATYHYSANFKKPFEFHPERYQGDPEFASDKLDVVQPFHLGTRNCIGKKYVSSSFLLEKAAS